MHYFDVETTARLAHISPENRDELRRLTRQEFARDEMIYELHLLRIRVAIGDGVLSLEEALQPQPGNSVMLNRCASAEVRGRVFRWP